MRALFDKVIKSHPMTSKYLASDASIVFDVVFESAITKIQNKNERFMTQEEVLAVKMLKKSEDERASATSISEYFAQSIIKDDFAQSIMKKKRMCDSGSDYEGILCITYVKHGGMLLQHSRYSSKQLPASTFASKLGMSAIP